jgi:transcriptional regulator with XRE-family HTH domain
MSDRPNLQRSESTRIGFRPAGLRTQGLFSFRWKLSHSKKVPGRDDVLCPFGSPDRVPAIIRAWQNSTFHFSQELGGRLPSLGSLSSQGCLSFPFRPTPKARARSSTGRRTWTRVSRAGSITSLATFTFCHLTLRCLKPKGSYYPKEIRTIGDLIRRRRLDLGLNQTKVGLRLGVHYVTVGEWERGRKEPSPKRLQAIEAFLGTIMEPTATYAEALINRLPEVRALPQALGRRGSALPGLPPATNAATFSS